MPWNILEPILIKDKRKGYPKKKAWVLSKKIVFWHWIQGFGNFSNFNEQRIWYKGQNASFGFFCVYSESNTFLVH